jgi:hypothetical protein
MADEKETQAEEAPKKPQWEYRKTFKINERMKEVLTLTKGVAEQEVAGLRKKLDRLTYGS